MKRPSGRVMIRGRLDGRLALRGASGETGAAPTSVRSETYEPEELRSLASRAFVSPVLVTSKETREKDHSAWTPRVQGPRHGGHPRRRLTSARRNKRCRT